MSTRARFAGLAAAVPVGAGALTSALGGDLTDALPALTVLTCVWWLFLLQAFSGRSARALVHYSRLRHGILGGSAAGHAGKRRTIAVPHRNPGAPRVAWSHDGWAHSDGHLVGLDRLDEHYEVVAFATEGRARGKPPVTLELLPARPYGDGLVLDGLAELLMGFDVVWAGGSYDGTTLQAMEARARGGPAILCYEVENVVANYGHLRHPIRERAVREVDHFAAISRNAKAALELDGVEPERISILPPVVEMPVYDRERQFALRVEGRRRWQLQDDDLVILFMGRAVWEKGLHTVAAAAATLAQSAESRNTRWLVAGEGDYLAEFERIVERYGAKDAIRITGSVSGRDRHIAYAAADVLVVPSLPTPRWIEQFGRVIPEGFAFGLPVIGSASGAIPEVVGDAGIVVAPGDHLALAEAVRTIGVEGRLDELRRRARVRAEGEYSVGRYIERLREAIEHAREHRLRSS